MELKYREMQKEEATQILKLGKSSFGLTEQLMMGKPKHAILALLGDEVVGAAAYQIVSCHGGDSAAFIELMFVKKGHEGKGIGNAMYRHVTADLKERSCNSVIAMVRDDNVASWKAFENAGYSRMTFIQMTRALGILGAVRIWLTSLLCIGVGHELWSTLPPEPSASGRQMLFYALLVLVGSLPALRFSFSGYLTSIAGILILLCGSVIGGGIAATVSKRKWIFRATRGGLLISWIVAGLGGLYPVVGRFYPLKYEHSPEFKRSMGIEALMEWIVPAGILAVTYPLRGQAVILDSMISFAPGILLYHAVPVFPFGSYGGTRIWEWNKVFSIVLLMISIILIWVI